jgi:Na+-translocating ferredoxin:NAD+ oxidoreductase subunit B
MRDNGRGKNRMNQGLGIQGTCYCPKCGYEASHQRGVPCFDMTCPKCGSVMTRQGLNPSESGNLKSVAKKSGVPSVHQDLCIGCGKCVSVCPVGAIIMKGGKAVINEDLCTGCGRCISVCPVKAII